MNVTDKHLASYRDLGFCVIKNLIPTELVSTAQSRIMEIADDVPDWPTRHFQILDPSIYRGKTGKPVPVGLQRPGLNEDVFSVIAEHDNLKSAMASLLAGEAELFTDQIGIKHGWIEQEQGGRSYFHQDSWYWKIGPALGCNCWIPMDTVDVDAIALAVMPESHLNWTLTEHESYYDDPAWGRMADAFEPFKRHRILESAIDYSKETLIPMEPGDGLFFTNYTWHRSEPNRSGQTRSFYAIAYQRTPA